MRLNSLADFDRFTDNSPEAGGGQVEAPPSAYEDWKYEHPYLSKLWEPQTGLGKVGDVAYGFGKVGSKIAKSVNPNAPDMPHFGKGEASGLYSGIGQALPGLLTGGGSLLGQAVAAGGWGAAQASPNEENAGGYLPSGRTGAAISDALGTYLGGKALSKVPQVLSKGAELAGKGINYMRPGKVANEFRATIGEGTAKENIENLGKRVQYAKGSAKEEALIPKRELYAQEGGSDVYNLKPEQTPEGNLPRMAQIINPEESAVSSVGNEGFTPDRQKALSKAIGHYRKTGDIEHFFKKSEDIFNVPELPEKAETQLEDALSLPTKRDSKYFSNKKVEEAYGDNGKIQELHDNYKDKPTLQNYDSLQSAIKKEQRKYSKMEERGTISDYGEKRLNELNRNIKNLDADKEEFMQTLPQNMQNLENDFRQKYAKNVGKYEKAPLTIRKLASGKWNEVTPSQIGSAFTNMTSETKDILADLGPSAAKNILYNAIQHVPMGDAEALAKTILDLKQTKGYDHIIDQETEKWASNMLVHARRQNLIKKGLLWGTGGLGLGGIGGFAAKHL